MAAGRVVRIALFFWLGLLGVPVWAEEPPPSLPPDFLPGQALVRFHLDTSLTDLKQIAEAASVTIERELTPWGLYLITFREQLPVPEAVRRLRLFPAVLYAEPNYQLKAFSPLVDTRGSAAVAGQAARPGVSVAVIDAGFDLKQPLLAGHLLENPYEIPGDGIDNDGNGYVDDFNSYDFYRQDSNIEGEGRFKFYGTRALQAVLSAGDAELSLLPLRAGPGPWLSTAALCEAIAYAVSRDVRVVSLSLGEWWASQALEETVAYAAQQKVILVASAGHENPRWLDSLGRSPQVIWVVAVQEKNWQARFSSKHLEPIHRLVLPNPSDATKSGASRNELKNHHQVNSVQGRVGKTAQFVRAKKQYLSRVDTPDLSMGDIDFTVTAWVLLNSKEEMVIMSKGDSTKGSSNEYLLRYSPDLKMFEFVVGNGKDSRAIGSQQGPEISTGVWYFLVASYETRGPQTSVISIQMNDGPIDAEECPPGVTSYDSPYEFTIGRYSNVNSPGSSGYMNGLIDEVGLWKRVLTSRERSDLYNRGLGNPFHPAQRAFAMDTQETLTDDLVAYYPFEGGDTLWLIGRISVSPFRMVGFIGLGLFLYSSISGVSAYRSCR